MGCSWEVQQWAQGMFGHCELGDRRRTRRLVSVVSHLASHVGRSVHASFRGDEAANEGAYRLVRNEAVEAEAVAEGGFAAALEAAHESELVLALEDTTTLGYSHAVREELGDVGGPAGAVTRGFHVHSVLLVDGRCGRTLGLAAQQRWCRSPSERGQSKRRAQRAYEDKESVKWQRSSEQLRERLGKETMSRVLSVCDREGDVYEYLNNKRAHAERFVVRAQTDRRTTHETQGLYAQAEGAPVLGTLAVKVAQRAERRAREAKVEVRACEVWLREPKGRDRGGRVCVHAVLAQEREGPAGEEALRWLLLTSEAVEDLGAASRVLEYYAQRWRIEEFHKAWKSGGTQVEALRLQSADNLERLAVMLAFIAVRVMQLREVLEEPEGEDEAGEEPRRCDEVLEELEWKVLWLTRENNRPLPERAPSLRWAYEGVARLGGWGDSKRTGRAGWKTLWEGWFRLRERVEGVRLMQQMHTPGEI